MTTMQLDLSRVNTMSMADAAAEYCRLGFAVFPLRPGSKVPVEGWPWKEKNCMNPPEAYEYWRTHPTYNIGLIMGKPSGVMALDVDTKEGRDGRASLVDIEGAYNVPCGCPVQFTPSEGLHLLFKYEPGFSNFTNKGTCGGLDFRTSGGYIVGAPSKLGIGHYAWDTSTELRPVPEPLRFQFLAWSTESQVADSDTPEAAPMTLKRVRELIDGLPPEDIDFLLLGRNTRTDLDDSSRLFGVTLHLLKQIKDSATVLDVLEHTYAMDIAERHTGGGQ